VAFVKASQVPSGKLKIDNEKSTNTDIHDWNGMSIYRTGRDIAT
jgi:hypothetical protein